MNDIHEIKIQQYFSSCFAGCNAKAGQSEFAVKLIFNKQNKQNKFTNKQT